MKAFRLFALTLVAGLSAPAFAQSASTAVTVGVTLTTKCDFTSGGLMSFTPAYTAFQTPALTGSQSAAIRCTRGSPAPTLTWNGGAVGTTVGVVRGLTYQLVATTGTIAPGAPPAGNLLTDLGSAATAPVTIALTVPAGQAGSDTGADVVRTLTVTF